MPFKKGHRGFPRKTTRISLGVTRTPSRVIDDEDDDDEEMNGGATPQDDVNGDEGSEDAATPTAQDDEEDASSPPTITTIPRRKARAGRPRGRTANTHTPEPGGDDGSESGTPARRKRGRPPGSSTGRARGGFRGRGKRGRESEMTPQVVIDKDGTTLDVVDDEALVDDDAEGNEKVDADGMLQGGREYRVRTFTILGRGERLYMLSTEPARCCGFRDSYLFFTKHPKLYKVLIGEDEKKDLIDRKILPNSYKGRNIGVVTARSVFREFGARIIVGGRRITDDYKVTLARENGEVEGELADPNDHVPDHMAEYNRNQYVAWHGASEVYRTQNGGNLPARQPGPSNKRRNNISLVNWQTMHAKEASRFNSTLTKFRQSTLNGVYDPHTNLMFYPKITQPTHARWEYIFPAPPTAGADNTSMSDDHSLPNGTTHFDGTHSTAMDVDPPSNHTASHTLFPPVPRAIARNFTVIDTAYEAPTISNAGFPGPDGVATDPSAGASGLSEIPPEVIAELPEACRAAFEEARDMELAWKKRWGTEAHSAGRGALKIGYSGYPV